MEPRKEGFFADLKEQAEDYINDRMLLVKVEAAEKIAGIASSTYIIIPIAVLGILILFMATFLGGYYLSMWLNSYAIGFGIMIGFYALLILLLMYMHKRYLRHKVADKIVKFMFSNKEEGQHEG